MLTVATVTLFQIWTNSENLSVTHNITHTEIAIMEVKVSESKRTFTTKEKKEARTKFQNKK